VVAGNEAVVLPSSCSRCNVPSDARTGMRGVTSSPSDGLGDGTAVGVGDASTDGAADADAVGLCALDDPHATTKTATMITKGARPVTPAF
jgi:hypothetical protein